MKRLDAKNSADTTSVCVSEEKSTAAEGRGGTLWYHLTDDGLARLWRGGGRGLSPATNNRFL